MIADEFPDIGRASVEGEEIIFEDLDAVETCSGDRLELPRKFAADRYQSQSRSSCQSPSDIGAR
ncbi:hypothetical protein ACOJBO_43290 [Rhizobium beringeri]